MSYCYYGGGGEGIHIGSLLAIQLEVAVPQIMAYLHNHSNASGFGFVQCRGDGANWHMPFDLLHNVTENPTAIQ